jgi:hypothetical protein
MTDVSEIPAIDEEEIEISSYDRLRSIALLLFATSAAAIFAAVVIYLALE